MGPARDRDHRRSPRLPIPRPRLAELLTLIEQIQNRATALEILESLLRYYVLLDFWWASVCAPRAKGRTTALRQARSYRGRSEKLLWLQKTYYD
jgi:hypothetical protein